MTSNIHDTAPNLAHDIALSVAMEHLLSLREELEFAKEEQPVPTHDLGLTKILSLLREIESELLFLMTGGEKHEV